MGFEKGEGEGSIDRYKLFEKKRKTKPSREEIGVKGELYRTESGLQ